MYSLFDGSSTDADAIWEVHGRSLKDVGADDEVFEHGDADFQAFRGGQC